MRYQVITTLTPRQALEQALADFGPGGLGLQITSQTNLGLVFRGGGGHIAVTAQPGAETTLELETREWDYAVRAVHGAGAPAAPLVAALVAPPAAGHVPTGFVHRARSLVGHHVYAEGRLLPPSPSTHVRSTPLLHVLL